MAEPTLQENIEKLAQAAVEHAQEYFATTLDFSESSVEDVELILARMYERVPRGRFSKMRRGPNEQQIAGIATLYGAYLGEVMRRLFGGRWEKGYEDDPEALVVRFTGRTAAFPMAWAWKRLTNGPEDDVLVKFRMFAKSMRGEELKEEPGVKLRIDEEKPN